MLLGPETKGEENGEQKSPVLIRLCGLGERRELCQRGPGRAPAQNGFYCNLISADRFC